jgi:uncharacterized protein (DUF2267 family)
MKTGVDVLEASLREARDWTRSTARRMRVKSHALAFSSLRATLHALRGQLEPEPERVFAFGERLPPVLKAVYFDGWQRARSRRPATTRETWMGRVEGAFDRNPGVKAERAAKAALETLFERLPAEAVTGVVESLPEDLAELWPDGPTPYTDLRIMSPPDLPPVDEMRRSRASPRRLRRATRRAPGERTPNALPERHAKRRRERYAP